MKLVCYENNMVRYVVKGAGNMQLRSPTGRAMYY